MPPKYLFILLACLLHNNLPAQDSLQFDFGNITPADFAISFPGIDSGTAAIVLADIGSATLEWNEGAFRVVYQRHTRIKILNRNGYDAAKITLRYSDIDNESRTLKSLQAATYNLEDGKVVRTALDEKDCFLDKPDPDLLEEKFTFPNIREGSIIEWTYTINSSLYFQLHPWYFQGKYPVVWSGFTVGMPDNFDYVFLLQGHHPLYKKTGETGKQVVASMPGSGKAFLSTARWVMKDVPPLKEEPFTSTLENHVACIRFQLSRRPRGSLSAETVLGTWSEANNRLLYDQRFGVPLAESNHWLKSDLKKITAGAAGDTAKARRLFAFVRDHFTARGRGLFLRDEGSLKDIFKKRSGSIAEINLLLVAMLRAADIAADPVILSTRDNGLTNAAYPIMDDFNYVIARARFGNTVYYLDASQLKMGFGKLPLACYNGHARAIAESPYAVYLEPDSLREFKMTTVYLSNNDKGGMTGYYTSTPGYYESLQLRNKLDDNQQARFFRGIPGAYPYPVELDSAGIDSLGQYDGPVTIHYNMLLDPGKGDILYFNPMLTDGMKENPFKSLKREYPVEMPYAKDEIYVLNMEVPRGYKIIELPKPVKIVLNGGGGFFEYGIAVNDNTIQLRSRVMLKKAIFEPEDYTAIRTFFGNIVKKQNEFIVFRKD